MYKYRKLSDELGFEIKTENQYQLALAGASKITVEDNKVRAEEFHLTEEYKHKYQRSPEELIKLLSGFHKQKK